MIIKPKIRGFICTNAHPNGCAKNVEEQIEVVRSAATRSAATRADAQANTEGGPRKVLVVGSSTGYGLASRITAAFSYGASTMGVFFEKPPTDRRTASAGFYNAAAFDQKARAQGLYAESFNADAFSDECKQRVIDKIKQDFGQIDLFVYSLASPRRTDPKTGINYMSTLKPIGSAYTAKNLNTDTQMIGEVTIESASEEEIANTVKVMGGEDWQLWVDAMNAAGVLAPACKTVAYTYIGEKLTKPIYGDATIGRAKEHLDATAVELNQAYDVKANIAVLKAVVTQASSAIPVMPLYLSILFKKMKEEGSHEGCIEQLVRLFDECLYTSDPRIDDANRFRVDERELRAELQTEIEAIWQQVDTENLHQLADFKAYQAEFLRLFGFGLDGVDYEQDVDTLVDEQFL